MPDANLKTEVFQAVTKGHNGLLDPMLLPEGQASRLHNVVVRNGLAESRPALRGTALPENGRFQGAFSYELEGNLRWVVVVSGKILTYSFATHAWKTVAAFPTTDFAQAYFCQVGKHCVVQNGVYDPVENWPVILHGDDVVDNLETEYIFENVLVKVKDFEFTGPSGLARDSDAIRVPIGKAMAFGQGRLFVAVERYYDNGLSSGRAPGWRVGEGLRHIVAGDDERGDEPARMFVFRQNDVLSGGGAISLPAENGFISSMAFFRNAATGTGLGELMVLCRRGAAAFAVSADRTTQWFSNGFGQQLFQSSGSASPWALIPVNSDLAYYGDGGLRTIKYTASSETSTGGLATIPLGPEVSNYAAGTLDSHEPFVTMAAADNYVFFTAGGTVLADGSVAFRDLLPWDLANFQVTGEQPSRVFAGAWRGPLFHAVLKASRTEAGAVFRDSAGGPLKFGIFGGAPDPAMVSVVRPKAYVFGGVRTAKRLKHADLVMDRVQTDLAVRVRWRVDGGAGWRTSDVRRFSSSGSNSTGLFRVPVESDNDGTGYVFEFAVEWTGHARLRTCALNAAVAAEFEGGEEAMCGTAALAAAGVDAGPEE